MEAIVDWALARPIELVFILWVITSILGLIFTTARIVERRLQRYVISDRLVKRLDKLDTRGQRDLMRQLHWKLKTLSLFLWVIFVPQVIFIILGLMSVILWIVVTFS